MTAWLDTLLFGIYPYICLAVFFIGSWARFDRDQYTWKSDSSQLLRTGSLRWGSNLFHIGVLFLFFGHTFGMLTPHVVYEQFISAGNNWAIHSTIWCRRWPPPSAAPEIVPPPWPN